MLLVRSGLAVMPCISVLAGLPSVVVLEIAWRFASRGEIASSASSHLVLVCYC